MMFGATGCMRSESKVGPLSLPELATSNQRVISGSSVTTSFRKIWERGPYQLFILIHTSWDLPVACACIIHSRDQGAKRGPGKLARNTFCSQVMRIYICTLKRMYRASRQHRREKWPRKPVSTLGVIMVRLGKKQRSFALSLPLSSAGPPSCGRRGTPFQPRCWGENSKHNVEPYPVCVGYHLLTRHCPGIMSILLPATCAPSVACAPAWTGKRLATGQYYTQPASCRASRLKPPPHSPLEREP